MRSYFVHNKEQDADYIVIPGKTALAATPKTIISRSSMQISGRSAGVPWNGRQSLAWYLARYSLFVICYS